MEDQDVFQIRDLFRRRSLAGARDVIPGAARNLIEY
jgi:hypothetical protein